MVDLEDLKDKASVATPGPWCHQVKDGAIFTTWGTQGGWIALTRKGDDCAYIAAANPSAVLELIDRLEKSEAERDALKDEIEAARKQEPCGWQCTIVGENNWFQCSKENYETVMAAPNEYPGFEVRAVYASPVPAQQPEISEEELLRLTKIAQQDGLVRVPAQRPAEVTPAMLRAAQLQSELGAIACSEMAGAYGLITELYEGMHKASLKGGDNER